MPAFSTMMMLVAVGLALYSVNRYVRIAPAMKLILSVAIFYITCAWLLQGTALWNSITAHRPGH